MANEIKYGIIKFFGPKGPIAGFFNNVSSLFEEGGKWSSMRFASLFSTILPLSVWAYVCIKTNTIASFPESIALIVVGSLGSKFLQKREEIKAFKDTLTDLKTMKLDTQNQSDMYGNSQYQDYNDYNNYNQNDYTQDNYDNTVSPDNMTNQNLDPSNNNNNNRKPRKY